MAWQHASSRGWTSRSRRCGQRSCGSSAPARSSPPGQIPFTPRAKKVLELALREALGLGHNDIGTEHILLGLHMENSGVGARILLGFDADSEKIRGEVARALADAEQGRLESEGAPSPAPNVERSIEVGFAEAVRELLMAAAARSLDDGRTEVELPDLLIALTEDELAASALAKLLIDKSDERHTTDGPEPGLPEEKRASRTSPPSQARRRAQTESFGPRPPLSGRNPPKLALIRGYQPPLAVADWLSRAIFAPLSLPPFRFSGARGRKFESCRARRTYSTCRSGA